jgi:rubrerythrin
MLEFNTVEDVLMFAISLEQASQEFYRKLADNPENAAVVEFLMEMVAQEQLHEQQLSSLVRQGLHLHIKPIPKEEIDRYVQAMDIPNELDYKKAVKIARDKENASRMLYSILAGLVENDKLMKLFLKLAEQEKNHKDFFQKEYDRICLAEN